MVIGIYVGCATVFGYAWWFMFYEGGPQITFWQLVSGPMRDFRLQLLSHIRPQTNFHKCSAEFPEIGCAMFSNDYAKAATTMSLSILVGKYRVLEYSVQHLTPAQQPSHRNAQRLQLA